MYKQTRIGRSGNFYEPGENAVWMGSSKIKDVCWITQDKNAERVLFCFWLLYYVPFKPYKMFITTSILFVLIALSAENIISSHTYQSSNAFVFVF